MKTNGCGMKKKLGLFSNEDQDQSLIEQLLKMMEKHKADYTNTFRSLTLDTIENTALFESPEFKEWYKLWQSRLERQEESKENAYEMMKNNNPSIILQPPRRRSTRSSCHKWRL